MNRKERINELFKALSLKADDSVAERLVKYVELWRKWNEKVRLTSKMTEDEFIQTQIATSLLLWRLFDKPGRYLDVGSGAGLPAIPLSLLLKDKTVLVESNYKKASFLAVCKRELGIAWLEVYNSRIEEAEDVRRLAPFQYITARAVAPIKDIIKWTFDLFGEETTLILPKGDKAKSELAEAQGLISEVGLSVELKRFLLPFGNKPYQVVVLKTVR